MKDREDDDMNGTITHYIGKSYTGQGVKSFYKEIIHEAKKVYFLKGPTSYRLTEILKEIGYVALRREALRNKSANMDVLVVMGTSAAYFYSVYQAIIMAGEHHSAQLYFETSAVLITLILLGKLFEARAKGRSSEAIKKLMGLQAKTALVITC